MFKIKIEFWWERCDPAVFNDAQRLARFVSGLPNFDSIYLSWLESIEDKTPFIPVPLSEEQAVKVLQDIRELDDEGQIWSIGGSSAECDHVGPKPYNCASDYKASTKFTIAQPPDSKFKLSSNCIYMTLAQIRTSTGRSWRASELRPLMKFVGDVWQVAGMSAYFDYYQSQFPSYIVPDPPNLPKFPGSIPSPPRKFPLEPTIGWITYLPPHLAARANIPAGFAVEGLSDGGVLVTVSEDPFPETDAVNIARLQTLETALRPIQSRD